MVGREEIESERLTGGFSSVECPARLAQSDVLNSVEINIKKLVWILHKIVGILFCLRPTEKKHRWVDQTENR